MRTGIAIVIALFAVNPVYAIDPDCAAMATDKNLTGVNKSSFIKVCQAEACLAGAIRQQLSGEARIAFTKRCLAEAAPSDRETQASNKARAEAPPKTCANIEQCGDLSTDLEATAAGMGGEAGMNSGHTFVRLRRLSE